MTRRSHGNAFLRLLSAGALSNLGDGVGRVAFPLLAATLTRDPVVIARLAAIQMLPWLLFGALAGAVLDRIDRRTAMLLANVVRAGVIGALGVLVWLDAVTVPALFGAALLMGTAETVADSALSALIPSVVDRDKLEGANSKLQSVEVVGQEFLGGPLGSVLFAVLAVLPFLVNSAAFAVAAVLLIAMTSSHPPKAAPHEPRTGTVEMVRWLATAPLLLRLITIAALFGLAIEFAQAQLVLYALQDLGIGEAAFGMFAFVGGLGGLIGAALATRLIRLASRRTVLLGSVGVAGLSTAGMGWTRSPAVVAVLFVAFAAAVVMANVVLATLRHLLVPDERLGRVIGTWRTVVRGAMPVGALLGGVVTATLGSPSTTFVLSGGGQLALALAAAIMLHRFRLEADPRVTAATGSS